MDTQSVADIYSELQDLTGADDSAAATLTLAYYVGKLTTFSGGDMLAHGIALGIRKGLWGVHAEDNSSIDYQAETIERGLDNIADQILAAGGKE